MLTNYFNSLLHLWALSNCAANEKNGRMLTQFMSRTTISHILITSFEFASTIIRLCTKCISFNFFLFLLCSWNSKKAYANANGIRLHYFEALLITIWPINSLTIKSVQQKQQRTTPVISYTSISCFPFRTKSIYFSIPQLFSLNLKKKNQQISISNVYNITDPINSSRSY